MAYSAKVGSFNLDSTKTTTQTISVTDVGFQPKIVLFWWSGSTGTGDGVAGGSACPGFGAAISTTSRVCITTVSVDAGASSDAARIIESDQCIEVLSNGATIDGAMDLSSLDADGFTLVVDNQFSANYRISYLALGGTDLSNVFIGTRHWWQRAARRSQGSATP